jgi:hypothetical protein
LRAPLPPPYQLGGPGIVCALVPTLALLAPAAGTQVLSPCLMGAWHSHTLLTRNPPLPSWQALPLLPAAGPMSLWAYAKKSRFFALTLTLTLTLTLNPNPNP